jgi:hypothetical protein
MYHLQARVTFKRNPKAALKALDTHIQEAEGLSHIPWIYALRLLRVTLSMQLPENHEIIVSLQHLKAVISIAKKNEDHAVMVAASALEALVHLRSDSPDYIMNCQESIARAQSSQMRKGSESISQVWAMIYLADLSCALFQCEEKQAEEKLERAHAYIKDLVDTKKTWSVDGSIAIPLGERSASKLSDYSTQIYRRTDQGESVLTLRWLDQTSAYTLGYLLGACSGILKKTGEKEDLLRRGLDFLAGELLAFCTLL